MGGFTAMLDIEQPEALRESVADMMAGRVSPVEEMLEEMRRILAETTRRAPAARSGPEDVAGDAERRDS